MKTLQVELMFDIECFHFVLHKKQTLDNNKLKQRKI